MNVEIETFRQHEMVRNAIEIELGRLGSVLYSLEADSPDRNRLELDIKGLESFYRNLTAAIAD